MFLSFFIYKGIVLGVSYIVFSFMCGFAGKPSFATFVDDMYNGVSSLGVVLLLCTDFDKSDEDVLRDPRCYWVGPARAYLDWGIFRRWAVFGVIHGAAAWIF